ncbi:hypothetical protein CASFOL_039846 [Castilleja foliolosa]|uniref:TF-B3 domain-containing protein n=1 Tax=Castilleja foliolosa TaxID=1961234 RepID=A0ABD3BH80_9LAMI
MAAPKFFKIILDPKTDSLIIPPEFAKRYGSNLPNPVSLKVPTGSSIAVELVPSDGKKLVLRKGWNEFRERYSIGFGHFLVFEYNGKSEFNVAIFDKTGVEINYVHAEYKTGEKRKIVKTENQENTTQAIQQIQSSWSKRDSKSKPDCKIKLHHESTYEEWGDIGSGRQLSTRVQMQRAVIKKETSEAYQKAEAFASAHINPKKKPFHIGLMHSSYVSRGSKLSIPFTFARQSLPCIGDSSVSMAMDGKRWPVRCLVRNGRAFLSGGWLRFAQDNGIKIGDVCIFKVAKTTTSPLWNVIVFRS